MTLHRENSHLTTNLTDEQENIIQGKTEEELQEVLDMLKNPGIDINYELRANIRESIEKTLRSLIIETDPKLTDLTKRLPKAQPTLRYETDAEVFELFPKPQPKPHPEQKPAEVIELAEHQLPNNEVVQYNESAKMYEFPGIA